LLTKSGRGGGVNSFVAAGKTCRFDFLWIHRTRFRAFLVWVTRSSVTAILPVQTVAKLIVTDAAVVDYNSSVKFFWDQSRHLLFSWCGWSFWNRDTIRYLYKPGKLFLFSK
jgi:hypothetical protein